MEQQQQQPPQESQKPVTEIQEETKQKIQEQQPTTQALQDQQEEIKMPPGQSLKDIDPSIFQQLQYPKYVQDLVKPRLFWDTQPVPKLFEQKKENATSGQIDQIKKVEEVRKTPYNLPKDFEWCDVDLANEQQLQDVYKLLTENYVEDEDNMFRFDYSIEFLKWALTPPGYFKDWIVGVRYQKNQQLVGFITGVPVNLKLEYKDQVKMAEINFLCVQKKLRANRLSPVLIKEITRRVNCKGIWQAVYTAGVLLPTPISKARYYHRSLNPKKLIDINFSSLGKNQTMSRVIKLYKIPEELKNPKFREMKKKDVKGVQKLLNTYLEKFKLFCHFTQEEVKHMFLPRKDVIYTYVLCSEEGDKQVTDFFSFYYLPSTIIKNPKYKTLRAVYSFYNVATTISLSDLMEDAIIVAKQNDFDVFNALDIMENQDFLKDLKFSPGDGNLHYYLYNWRLSNQLDPKDLGMVLV